jgi:hypothetical protein
MCGGDLINTSQLSRYENAIASIPQSVCDCGVALPPQCVNHRCTSPVDVIDAGPPPDAGVCVNVDVSTYDQSCTVDSDCVEISAGLLCDKDCLCGGSTINGDGQARYDAAIAPLGTGPACSCPGFGNPRCVKGHCTMCGGPGAPNQPGCPDGG